MRTGRWPSTRRGSTRRRCEFAGPQVGGLARSDGSRVAAIVWTVLPGTYHDPFVAIAGAARALTGLLFVALSVAPRRTRESGRQTIQQVRAAAALLAFTNALAVTLFGLVPGTNVGEPATVLGVIGLLFTAAGARSIFSTRFMMRTHWRRQIGLIFLLLAIFTVELVSGIAAIVSPHDASAIQIISYALVTSLIVGIARAWELVGDRDTGIIASIAVLAGHEKHLQDDPDDEPLPAEPGPAEPADDAS